MHMVDGRRPLEIPGLCPSGRASRVNGRREKSALGCASSMKWRKNTGSDVWIMHAGPYVVTIAPKGDGRWNWTIVNGDKPNPEATGVRPSLGGAKTACELFVKRSGHV